MGGLRQVRKRGEDTLWSSHAANVRMRRLETRGVAPAAVLDGLDPGRLDRVARTSVLTQIGSLAGNAAVADLVAHVRTDHALDPPEGVREIRRVMPGGTLGHTRLSIEPSPPLFRLPTPESTGGGYAVRPSRTRLPEPEFEVRYPTAGRHVLYEATNEAGAPANTYLEISADWSAKILHGEEEHVGDQTIAWQDTWKRVAGIVNQMAADPPVTSATPDEARRAAWSRFVSQLPGPLRPDGADPSESAQQMKWGFDERRSVFWTLINESKRARDVSQWHTPEASLDHMEGASEIRSLATGNSRIDATKPEDLMRAAWARLPGAGGAASGGGQRRR